MKLVIATLLFSLNAFAEDIDLCKAFAGKYFVAVEGEYLGNGNAATGLLVVECESNRNSGDFSLIIPAVISKEPSKNSEAVFINGYLTRCERIDPNKGELNCQWFTSGSQASKGPASFNLSLVKKPKSKEKDIQIYGAWTNLDNSIQGRWKGIKE